MLAEDLSISQMAGLLNVSLRTLRFYEQIGLVSPRRIGATRFYTAQDRVQLRLVLTGKKLGLSLAEIERLIAKRLQAPENDKPMEHSMPGSLVDVLTSNEILQQLQVLERQKRDVEDALAQLRAIPDGAPEMT